MKVLIIGSGGREHALAWRLAKDEGKENIFIAPGNAGTNLCGKNIDCPHNDFEGIAKIICENDIEMVVIGPEDPLVNGLSDFLKNKKESNNLLVIGPSAQGAMLEGSKDFAKQFMIKNNIPTASYKKFTKKQKHEAIEYINKSKSPYVLKADGLAAGKGVIIANSAEEAIEHINNIFDNDIFGKAGQTLLIEEFLNGVEMSVFALTDGKSYIILPNAKDYKRIGDGDTGPNTGGMGTVSPVPFANEEFMNKVETQIIRPTILGLEKGNIEYYGFLFFGLMNVDGNPFVIEYNVRMGDPETQVVMPRIGGSFSKILAATCKGILGNLQKIEILPQTTISVVLASEGYPANYKKGEKITIFEKDELIFHAGTSISDGKLITSGGRVMAVVGSGKNISEARKKAYLIVEKVDYKGKIFRKDIGLDLKKYETD